MARKRAVNAVSAWKAEYLGKTPKKAGKSVTAPNTVENPLLDAEEKELLAVFRQLQDAERKAVLQYVESKVAEYKTQQAAYKAIMLLTELGYVVTGVSRMQP